MECSLLDEGQQLHHWWISPYGYVSCLCQLLVKYLKAMTVQGLTIRYMTIQNEPLNGNNNPSMYMSSYHQGLFIKDHLAPALSLAGLTTKLLLYDHNADQPNYPMDLLNDPAVKEVVDGSAFHLYGGTIDSLTMVHEKHSDRKIYFAEQYTSVDGDFEGDLMWHAKHIWIGSLNHWAKIVLEWNLSSNPTLTPHARGGCTKCLGAITIDGNTIIRRNVAYYMVAHVAPYLPSGSVRNASSWSGGGGDDGRQIHHVAFRLSNEKTTVLMNNESLEEDIKVLVGGKELTLPSRSVVTVQF